MRKMMTVHHLKKRKDNAMAKDMMKLQLAYKGSEYSRTVVVQTKFSLAFLHEAGYGGMML